jgi:polysaccharide deacetylase 2 family uncharacterized protein YibQ
MDRRNFLRKSAVMLAGCCLGFGSASRGFACEKLTAPSFFEPRAALIIDDIGNSRARARQFLALDIPITFSILPQMEHSHALASEIHRYGHEIMLHQPMEPYNSRLDPGPGALYVGEEASTISKIIKTNISDVPHAIGVNNHMGSRFTACKSEITETLRVIKENDLFFIDSLTSHFSKAYKTAIQLHMVTARRNVFLDHVRNEAAILYQLHTLARYARKYGFAVGIGHPFPETVWAIGDFLKNHSISDISLVHISDILYS